MRYKLKNILINLLYIEKKYTFANAKQTYIYKTDKNQIYKAKLI